MGADQAGPVLEPAQIGVELVTRNESGSDPAGDRLKLALTDECANVVLGAAELDGIVQPRRQMAKAMGYT